MDAELSHERERCDEGSDEVANCGRNPPTRSVSVVSVMAGADGDPVSESRSRFRRNRLRLVCRVLSPTSGPDFVIKPTGPF